MTAITIRKRLAALERLKAKPVTKVMTIAFADDDGRLTDRDGQPIERQSDRRYLVIHVVKPTDSV
jgi:hypothetical protein